MFNSKLTKWGCMLTGAAVLLIAVAVRSDSAPPGAPLPDAVQAHREKLRQFAEQHAGSGSVEEGRKLFLDGRVACASCHTVGDGPGRRAPDLGDVGAKYDLKELISSVLEPSQRIAEGYQGVTLTLKDGRTVQGLLRKRTDTHVEVFTRGRTERFERDTIERLELDPLSGMPEGLVDGLTEVQFADLIAYLGSLRQNGPVG
jgi:putative heme-binding domain-containing protein